MSLSVWVGEYTFSHYYKLFQMAFVYRKQKAHQQLPQYPGPGQYNTVKESFVTNSAVGFVDTVPRNLWQKVSTTPGPGQYNLTAQATGVPGSQPFYSNPDAEFYVYDNFNVKSGGCSSTFKSKGKKFTSPTNQNPGPGQYEIDKMPSKRSPSCRRQKTTKLARYLYEENRKPDDYFDDMAIDAYSALQNLISEIHTHQQKAPGPKKSQLKNNYKSIFNSKVERRLVTRPQTSTGVGPGTYKIEESYPLPRKSFNCKPAPPLSCKSGADYNLEEKANKQKENVGPGSYELSHQRPHTSQSRGIPCFGSKEQRFDKTELSRKTVGEPGPQSYFKPTFKLQKKKPKKKLGFNTRADKKDEDFHFIPSTNFRQISPFSYKPKNDFNQLLKKNYTKGHIGKFGSTVQRFKEAPKISDPLQKPLTQAFAFDFQCDRDEAKPKTASNFHKVKKASPKRAIAKKQVMSDQRPICYDLQFKTIGSKFSQKTQKDAPFMVASARFDEKVPDYEEEIIKSLMKDQSKAISIGDKRDIQEARKEKLRIFKGTTQNLSLFKKYQQISSLGQQWLVRENEVSVGPQTYTPELLGKKSYNIFFNQ